MYIIYIYRHFSTKTTESKKQAYNKGVEVVLNSQHFKTNSQNVLEPTCLSLHLFYFTDRQIIQSKKT